MDEVKPGYTTGIEVTHIAKYCVLVGDPARVYRFAKKMDNIEYEKKHREYVTITGLYKGVRLTVMGTGMGGASTEMAIVELSQCHPNLTFIRCGSCGGLTKETKLGDLVISTSALRFENTSLDYADSNLPAIAHSDVLLALIQAAQESRQPYHVGMTATMPSFYVGQGRDTPPFRPRNQDIVQRLSMQNVINMEMEASVVFTMAHLARHRAGAICTVYAERVTDKFITSPLMEEAEDRNINVVLAAILILRKIDLEKGVNQYWHPGLHGIHNTSFADNDLIESLQ